LSSTERGKPLKRRYREFGLTLGSILLAAGMLPLLRHAGPRLWAVYASGIVYLASAAYPGLLAMPFRFMVRVGHVLGGINAKVILGLFYFLFFVPVALVMRVLGKRPIDDSFKPEASSYWVRREKASDPRNLERMF